MSLSKEWVNTELSNSEFEVLEEFLEKLPHILAPGGRVAILTFHSGEDRLVKKIWKRQQKNWRFACWRRARRKNPVPGCIRLWD